MKKLILISVISSLALADCGYKIQKLERELEYAQKYGNHNRAIGLERAIGRINAKCGGGNYFNDAKFSDNKSKIEKLEDELDAKLDKIDDELDALNDNKKNMSKEEYKRKKAALKAEKKRLKQKYKEQKRALKHG